MTDITAADLDEFTGLYARYARNEKAPRAVNDVVTLMGNGTSNRFDGHLFTVAKVNPTTLILTPADGGLPVKAHRSLVEAAPAGSAAKVAAARAVALPHQPPGALLRWKGAKAVAGIHPGEVCVVLVDKGDRIHVAKIGGVQTPRGDAYTRQKRQLFETVSPAAVLAVAEVRPVA